MVKFGRKPGWPSRAMRKRVPAERMTAGIADEILEFLKTGRPRDVKEAADAVDLPEDKVQKVLDFLTQIGLIRKSVQITDLGSNFLMLPTEKWKRRL